MQLLLDVGRREQRTVGLHDADEMRARMRGGVNIRELRRPDDPAIGNRAPSSPPMQSAHSRTTSRRTPGT